MQSIKAINGRLRYYIFWVCVAHAHKHMQAAVSDGI